MPLTTFPYSPYPLILYLCGRYLYPGVSHHPCIFPIRTYHIVSIYNIKHLWIPLFLIYAFLNILILTQPTSCTHRMIITYRMKMLRSYGMTKVNKSKYIWLIIVCVNSDKKRWILITLSTREKGWHGHPDKKMVEQKTKFWDHILSKPDGLTDDVSMYWHSDCTDRQVMYLKRKICNFKLKKSWKRVKSKLGP